MKEKINKILKKFSWKSTVICILILYALIWSYLYLGIQYAEHRQNYLNNAYNNCLKINFTDEARESCVENVKENSIKVPFWDFLFVDIEKVQN